MRPWRQSAWVQVFGHHEIIPNWRLPKSWGYPQISSIDRWDFPGNKPSILGDPPFLEPSGTPQLVMLDREANDGHLPMVVLNRCCMDPAFDKVANPQVTNVHARPGNCVYVGLYYMIYLGIVRTCCRLIAYCGNANDTTNQFSRHDRRFWDKSR